MVSIFRICFQIFVGKKNKTSNRHHSFFENQFVFFFYIKKRRKETMLNITKSSFGVYIELANSRSGPGSRRAPF